MKCTNCGKEMIKTQGAHRYTESGLPNIILMDIPVHRCIPCKEEDIEIPFVNELHMMIGFILSLKPSSLTSSEARFLRKHLGYTADELADKMGVTRITVTRWESGDKGLLPNNDKHLRRLYLDKKGDNLKKIPAVKKLLNSLLDFIQLKKEKTELKIHADDWACVAG